MTLFAHLTKTAGVLLLLCSSALGQSVWYNAPTPIPENAQITAGPGMSFRLGSFASQYAIDVTVNATIIHHAGDPSVEWWSPVATMPTDTAAAMTFTASTAYFTNNDMLFGVVKQIQVLETNAVQTFTYTAGGAPVTVTVPALTAPQPPIVISAWTGPRLNCWKQKASDDAGDGGHTYVVEICEVPK